MSHFLLYVVMPQEIIGMVLVEEGDEIQEHVIYYLNHALYEHEMRYSHVDKLALETVYAVQRLIHYILLRISTVVVGVNAFQFVSS